MEQSLGNQTGDFHTARSSPRHPGLPTWASQDSPGPLWLCILISKVKKARSPHLTLCVCVWCVCVCVVFIFRLKSLLKAKNSSRSEALGVEKSLLEIPLFIVLRVWLQTFALHVQTNVCVHFYKWACVSCCKLLLTYRHVSCARWASHKYLSRSF